LYHRRRGQHRIVPHELRIGCSGWNYRDWRDPVYGGLPARRWLERYAQLFDTVEVNATFYRLPRREVVQRWAEGSPEGFCFAVKSSRYLTHIKRLTGLAEGIERFEERIGPLREHGKLGPVLWQLPATFHRDDDRLADALDVLPAGRHAFEFRHPSWFVPEVEALLAAHDAALVIGDDPRRPFQTLAHPASWTFVRFHRGRAHDGAYGLHALHTWADRIRGWQADGDVYAYFNNDWRAHAPRNALTLLRLLGRSVPVLERRAA
jgi:uncharacterized protein YecE (DUF72 family)